MCVYSYTHTPHRSWDEVYLLRPSTEVVYDCSVLWPSGRRLAPVPLGKEAGLFIGVIDSSVKN